MSRPVYFAHISDTHIGPTVAYARHGFRPYPCVVRLVELLNNLPTPPDFVIHTGDITTDPTDAAYELAAALFARLRVPIYYVNGNHDTADHIRKFLTLGPHTPGGAPQRLSYTFAVRGERFLVLDGRGPDAIDPHGVLADDQLDLVRRTVADGDAPLTVFVHFPALPLNAPWMDANMLLLNGDALHAALLPARHRLRGVFHGHVHQPMQTVRDGIVYTCAPSAFAQFTAWPSDVQAQVDPDGPPGYSFVHCLPGQTIVHHHAFARPGA